MRKILLIDKGSSSVRRFSKSLKSRGYSIVASDNLKSSFPIIKKGDIELIVVDKDFSSPPYYFNQFKKLTASIPKVIVTGSRAFSGLNAWINNEIAVPLYEPFTCSEFMFWVNKLRKENESANLHALMKEEAVIRRKELIFFEHFTKILTSTFEIDKTLNMIMRQAKLMTGFDAWSIQLVEGVSDEFFFGKNHDKNSIKIHKSTIRGVGGVAGWVAKTGTPVVVPDVSKDKRFSRGIDGFPRLDIKSLMCVPVKIKNSIIGVFEFYNAKSRRPFTEKDLELLLKLVGYASMAIEKTLIYQKMENLAVTDELTNLFNIRYLTRTLDAEVERSQRFGTSFSLIFMDIDFFKNVNDSFGHLVGSKLLIEVAQLILGSLRTIDTVARYGGDEFVMILPQTPLKGGFYVAERIRKDMEKKVFLKHEGYMIRVTASFGVATYPENAKTKEELLKIADKAMYRGKNTTRNVVYSAG
jgi:diguanylate cyclase (GGDEF)-like protein